MNLVCLARSSLSVFGLSLKFSIVIQNFLIFSLFSVIHLMMLLLLFHDFSICLHFRWIQAKYDIAGFSLVFSTELGVYVNNENYTHVVLYSKNKTDNWFYKPIKLLMGWFQQEFFFTIYYQIYTKRSTIMVVLLMCVRGLNINKIIYWYYCYLNINNWLIINIKLWIISIYNM